MKGYKSRGARGYIGLFYATLQTESSNGSLNERDNVHRVAESDNIELIREVTDEEVKNATFSMHLDQSPGLDGLNPAFFQSFWNVVGRDVISFCRTYMNSGVLPKEVNQALVRLIPKIQTPPIMVDLMPISLCNVLVHILSKFMSNRLKSSLKAIISDK